MTTTVHNFDPATLPIDTATRERLRSIAVAQGVTIAHVVNRAIGYEVERVERRTPHPSAEFDPLAAQVGARETEAIQRDPELDARPTITKAFNGREPGIRAVDPDPSMIEGRYR